MANQLEVGIGLRDKLSGDLKKSLGAVRRFTSGAGNLFKGLGRHIFSIKGLIAGVVTGIAIRKVGGMVTEFADMADAVGKLSTRLGLSTEYLSEMAFVADRSGVKISALNVGMQRLSRRLAEFQSTGGKGTAASGFEALGLTDFALQVQDVEALVPRLADAFRGMESDTEAVAAAFSLFDSEGVSFLQFLKEGSAGIDGMRKEARQFGQSLSKEVTRQAAEFNDALTNLSAAFDGLKRKAIEPLLPALQRLAEIISNELLAKQSVIGDAIDSFAKSLKSINASEAVDGLKAIGQVALTVAEALIAANQGVLTLINGFRSLKLVGRQGLEAFADVMDSIAGTSGKPTKEWEAETRALESRILAADRLIEKIGDLRRGIGNIGAGKGNYPNFRELMAEGAARSGGPAGSLSIGSGLLDGEQAYVLGIERDVKSVIDQVNTAAASAGSASDDSIRSFFKAQQAREAEEAIKAATSSVAGFADALRTIEVEGNAFNVARGFVLSLNDSISGGLTDALSSIIEGTKSVKEAFKSMAQSVISDITRIVIKLLLMRVVSAAAGYAGGIGIDTSQNQSPDTMATGGIGNHGSGELILAHGREAHVPLPDGKTIPVTISGGRGGGGFEGGGPTVINNYHIQTYGPKDFDEYFRDSASRQDDFLGSVVAQRYQSDPTMQEAMGRNR